MKFGIKPTLITREQALPGRPRQTLTAERHLVLDTPIHPPFPAGCEQILVALGCFWGAERMFWQLPGVYTTAVGYSGGFTPNPTYEEVCSGLTGHAETVLVVFDPARLTLEQVLKTFWEGHDPTQGLRQGNDVGSQYRSAIFCTTPAQAELTRASRDLYAEKLTAAGYTNITTTIEAAGEFYYAEDYHQQYLEKNPMGYCGHGGTGVSCPIGLGVS